jgi:hypothetical protein
MILLLISLAPIQRTKLNPYPSGVLGADINSIDIIYLLEEQCKAGETSTGRGSERDINFGQRQRRKRDRDRRVTNVETCIHMQARCDDLLTSR